MHRRQAPQPFEGRLDGDAGVDPRGTRRSIDVGRRLIAGVDQCHRSPRAARKHRLKIGFGNDHPALEDPRFEEPDDFIGDRRPFVVGEREASADAAELEGPARGGVVEDRRDRPVSPPTEELPGIGVGRAGEGGVAGEPEASPGDEPGADAEDDRPGRGVEVGATGVVAGACPNRLERRPGERLPGVIGEPEVGGGVRVGRVDGSRGGKGGDRGPTARWAGPFARAGGARERKGRHCHDEKLRHRDDRRDRERPRRTMSEPAPRQPNERPQPGPTRRATGEEKADKRQQPYQGQDT